MDTCRRTLDTVFTLKEKKKSMLLIILKFFYLNIQCHKGNAVSTQYYKGLWAVL